MQNKYYYLVASLPYLKFSGEPPISKEDFFQECGKWLAPEDMSALISADRHRYEERPEDPEASKTWKKFDTELRKELARIRAARKTSASYKTGDSLKSVMDQENPLLMEKKLERIRWDFLEDKEPSYMFDVNRLVIYFLKLKILERLDSFNKDKGEAFFYSLCEVHYE
ncbi:MAG: DUF2764 family protein [Candidatus Omnitrophota bacterium]|jgi:hypothetical protein